MIRFARASVYGCAISALLMTGCAVGPVYHEPPEAPVMPPVAVQALSSDVNATSPSEAWWRSVNDPILTGLVERALAGNTDLRQAVARLRQSRALFHDAALDRLPRVTAGGAYARSDTQEPGFGDNRVNIEFAQLGFDATWELDIFGRVRHSVESARAMSEATAYDLADVRVSVAAEVARTYFVLRGAQRRREVAERNVDSQRQTLALTRQRVAIGTGDPVDVEAARARLAQTEATIPEFTAGEAQAAYRLSVLLGVRPGELDGELAPAPSAADAAAAPLAIGDVSDFLRRRPDVRAAERRLAGQTARIGVATADLFPRVTLSGFLGFLSGDVPRLFASNAQAWSVTPNVTWPGFELGGARARLRAQAAQGDAELAAYDGTVLRAIEDLQGAIVAYGQRRRRIASLAEQVAATVRADRLAHIRYDEGAIDFLRVLDADRTKFEAEDALAAAEVQSNTDLVAVYKALGAV